MVRLVHANPNTGPVHLRTSDGTTHPTVRPGEFTRHRAVPGRLPGIVLGRELARRLEAEVGDEITLVTPLRGVDHSMLGPSGTTPSSTRHVVTGVFESGFYEYDVRLALVGITAAQRFLNRGKVIRWLEVRADDLMQVRDVRRRVAASLDPFDFETVVRHSQELARKLTRIADGEISGTTLRDPVGMIDQIDNAAKAIRLLKYQDLDFGYHPRFRLIDWQEMNTNLLGALKLQKVVLTIFFLIIIVVGSFVVVGSQIMVIHEKTADIVILKAMGCTRSAIRLAFTLQGLLVASIGTAVGLGVGAGLVALLGVIDFPLDASVYLIDHLPVRLDTLDLLLIAGATGICTVIATQYSAGKAASQTVVDGLRSLG
jgi:lipoprotein-releasing system permease protein